MSSGPLQTPARKRIGARPHSLRALLLRRVLTVIAVALSFHSMGAQTRAAGDQRIMHESWTFKEGAPESVLALAQTADGYLWLGTLTGLFHFDGSRFELFRPDSGDPLPWTDVPALFAPRTGGLWIGYRSGGFSFLKNGRLTNFKPNPGPATVQGFAQDRHGIVWAATWNGVWRFDGSSWQPNPAGWEKGLQADQVGLDRDGTLWVLTTDKGVEVGRQLFYLMADGAKFQKAADHLFVVGFTWDADSTILTTRERAPGELGSGIVLDGSLPAYPILKKNSDQVVDRNNGIWFVPRGPFILRHPAGEPLNEIVGKASPDNSQIYDINPYRYARLVGRDGSFWMGDRSGLHRFSYTPLIEAPLPKAPGTRFTVAPDDAGVVWISNEGGDGTSTLYRVAGDRAEVRGRQGGSALFAYRAPDKTLWFGAEDGLVHMVAGRLQETRLPPEMADKPEFMKSITQDRSGGMWLSLGGIGLYLLKDGTWTKLGGHRDLIPWCLIEFTDNVGRVWFGSKANRIEMLDGGRVRVFGPGDVSAPCGTEPGTGNQYRYNPQTGRPCDSLSQERLIVRQVPHPVQPRQVEPPRAPTPEERSAALAYQREQEAILAPTGTSGSRSIETASSPARTAEPGYSALPDLRQILARSQSATPSSTDSARTLVASNDDYAAQNMQSRKEAFLTSAASRQTDDYLRSVRTAPLSRYEIKAGWEIPAALEQNLNSDLPGELKALVTSNVYDTATGMYLLIPQGSRLIGEYDSRVSYGQDGVQVAWSRIVFPDASVIDLNGMVGLDAHGNAGLRGKVDRHYRRLLGFSVLTSMFTAAFAISQQRNQSVLVNPNPGQIAAGSVGQELSQTGSQITRRNLNVQPTIKVPAGYKFTVRVNRDILFEAPYDPVDARQ